MRKHNAVPFPHPQMAIAAPLTAVIRQGARRLLAQAIEAEVETWLACYADGRDEQGRQAVVRNGYLPEREVQTGMDAVSVHVPRVRGCWVHKTGNVLNYLPKGKHKQAKQHLQAIWIAASRQAAKAFDYFVLAYGAKYSQAVACLSQDRDVLLTFYDFPAEPWVYIRTTKPVESTFATVRLRTGKTRGCLSQETAFTMVFKLQRLMSFLASSSVNCVIKG